MKKLLVLLIFIYFLLPSKATHIAGGDFSVEWIGGNNFKVTLKLFRDCASGGANFDNPINITVFDNVTNAQVQVFTLNFISRDTIQLGDSCYTPPPLLCVEQGLYTDTINLADNPNGYYMAWERCCRNPTIENIVQPSSSGMVFYVQVSDPALENSTPVFGDYPIFGYLCQGVMNWIDFDVTEVDGDSLVYSLIDPLMGSLSSSIDPAPNSANPKPYAPVTWQAPYSLNDIVGGVPSMAIDPQNGIITCKPSGTGIFAFAVKIQEFRNGNLISEIIRDVQYNSFVCDSCLLNVKDDSKKPGISIQPNPFDELLIINSSITTGDLFIFSMTGQLLHSSKLNLSGSQNLNLYFLDAGAYLIMIKNESESYYQKIIKNQ